jgi:hypothetical protein
VGGAPVHQPTQAPTGANAPRRSATDPSARFDRLGVAQAEIQRAPNHYELRVDRYCRAGDSVRAALAAAAPTPAPEVAQVAAVESALRADETAEANLLRALVGKGQGAARARFTQAQGRLLAAEQALGAAHCGDLRPPVGG